MSIHAEMAGPDTMSVVVDLADTDELADALLLSIGKLLWERHSMEIDCNVVIVTMLYAEPGAEHVA